jgi:methylmalonic aciduria homocystinuria type C protein
MANRCAEVTWDRVATDVASRCRPAGLDLVQALRVSWYNDRVETAFRLPDFRRPAALAVVIGNTRVLWGRFLAALRAAPERLGSDDPLEAYVMENVRTALAPLAAAWEIRWAHETTPAPVAMQRLAHAAGLAYLAPSHLNVHPVHGPWIALRAVVVVDIDGPPGEAPDVSSPCDDCERTCMVAFRHALDVAGHHIQTHDALETHWQLWLAVRDACPTGRAHRYDDEQIRYHYTKDRAILRRAATHG